MKTREKLVAFFKNSAYSVRRFPCTSACVLLTSVISFIIIFGETNDVTNNGLFSAGLGAFLFLACELWREKSAVSDSSRVRFLAAYIAASLLIAVSFGLLFIAKIQVYVTVGMCVLAAAAVLFAVRLLTKGDENLRAAAVLVHSFLIACGTGLVVWLGSSGCYAAFCELMLSGFYGSKVPLALLVLAFALGVFVFLAGIPVFGAPASEDRTPSKAYKIVFAYAELPIFLLLLGILYLYLIKIACSLHLPDGGVNAYAVTADVLYLFNLFAVSVFAPSQPLVRFFRRFGGLLLVPVLVMQSVAVGVRIYYYGLTLPRMVLLLFMAVTLAMTVGSFVRKIGVARALGFSAVLVILLTVTPLNIFNLPLWQQSAALKQVLRENGMFENGKVVQKDNVPDQAKRKITEAYDYLNKFSDNLPSYLTSAGVEANFGFERPNPYETQNSTAWCNYQGSAMDDGIDVANYAFIKHIYLQTEDESAGEFRFTSSDGTEYSIPYQAFNDYAGTLLDTYGEGYFDDIALPPYPIAEGIDFIPLNINFTHDRACGELSGCSFDGYLLCQ